MSTTLASTQKASNSSNNGSSPKPAAVAPTVGSEVACGSDIVVQSLVNHGVDTVFAYPGGASIPLHQSLTRFRDRVRVILPRHEQGGGFAAQGYARSTGKIGVAIATSGPGATNLVTAIADAKLDSIPMLCLTGQVGTNVIGTDAFQETPIVEVCRSVTKHHYLVTNVNDIARVMREAFHIATTGRPGPVLVDLPKNIQLAKCVPDYNAAMDLPGYRVDTFRAPAEQLREIAALIRQAKRPVIYAGGGILASGAHAELTELARKTGIPVTTTLMGVGGFPGNDPLSLSFLGMHGSVYANYAVDESDLLLALGVRFDDRVTGKVSAFATGTQIVHIDVDPSEINKIKRCRVGVVSDIKYALGELNKIVHPPVDLTAWHARIAEWKKSDPFEYDRDFPGILPQHAISVLWELCKDRETFLSTGVGQHQMWAAQYFKFTKPRHWLSSLGLGTMGFGLPAAMGAKAAHPDCLVIDIDGDGSFLMNVQEMATCYTEKLPVKVLLLNNMHLGMVVQWEDRFHESNRAHTYLGPIDHPEAVGQGDGITPEERYPDFVNIARGFKWGSRHVREKEELRGAIQEMIDYPGPYLLDVQVPYQEHVLPMIPSGMTVKDLIEKISMADEEELYQEHILEHYEEPYHRGHCPACTHAHEDDNPLCGDVVRMELAIDGGTLRAVYFNGDGCCISQAAASMLVERFDGRSVDDVKHFTATDMLKLFGVRLTPNRQKCCLLPWRVLQSAIYSPIAPAKTGEPDDAGSSGSTQARH